MYVLSAQVIPFPDVIVEFRVADAAASEPLYSECALLDVRPGAAAHAENREEVVGRACRKSGLRV